MQASWGRPAGAVKPEFTATGQLWSPDNREYHGRKGKAPAVEGPRPVIRCTTKLRAAIDDSPIATRALGPQSSTGDWYGHVFSLERRKCIVFIHEPTLFVCLALDVTKAAYRHIAPFFLDLLDRTLRHEAFSEKERTWLLSQHRDLPVGRTQNRSTLGSLNNRVADTKLLVHHRGGVDCCDVGTVNHLLNETPMKPIRYRNGLEEMRILVSRGLAAR